MNDFCIVCVGFSTKARSVLEQARQRNAKCAELWLEAIRIEIRGDNKEFARSLMAKGFCFLRYLYLHYNMIIYFTCEEFFQC